MKLVVENDKDNPTLELAIRKVRYLETTVEELFQLEEKMKKKSLAQWLYLALLLVDFYLLPLLIKDTGSGIFLLLLIMPLLVFLGAVIYGVRYGLHWLLPLAAVIAFIPSIFLYYNETAWSYGVIYGVVAAEGNGVGRIFYNKR